jgi:hypothetical protein
MKPWKPDHAQDDPPKDPEIQRWFQDLGPPPEGQAPSDLRAKVLARIEEQRGRRGMFAWVSSVRSPAWAAALALVLVVSLGLNVWWAVLRFGLRPPDTRPPLSTVTGDFGSAGPLRTYRFQLGMARTKELGKLIAAQPARLYPTGVVGFTPQAARSTFFHMGTLYADALAALHGAAFEEAGQRLDVLSQALVSVQAPRALPQYIRAVHTWLQQRQYEDEVLAQFLALFEPLYEDAYAKAESVDGVILFRTGTWVENMALAAAVDDRTALRLGGEAIEEVRRSLAQLQVPREVLTALERLHAIVARQALTDREIRAIHMLVQDIQRMLSE